MSSLKSVLIRMLDEAYDQKAWHGPNLKGALHGISPSQASWRPGPGRHNIWELLVHSAYWKYAVWRRCSNGPRGSFPEKGSNWFRRDPEPDLKAFRRDLSLLDEQHQRLKQFLAGFPSNQLLDVVKDGKTTFAHSFQGAAFHDVYHAGQIRLLRKLQGR